MTERRKSRRIRAEGWERRFEKARRLASVRSWWPFIRFAPPGHFYSPIPDLQEVEVDAARLFGDQRPSLVGIDLRPQAQIEIIQSIGALVKTSEFSMDQTSSKRFYWQNIQYGLADAFTLVGMLRLLRPRRVIEVGSGFSSAAMFDAIPAGDATSPHYTFIEPFPARLRSLLQPDDADRFDLLERRVQDVPLSTFTELEANDLLFIDSSHVVKTGGDVVYLLTEVIPRLAQGVVIHIHDIFYPFEIPESWVRGGRAWAETYLVKAFLQFNSSFEITVFIHWLHTQEPDVLAAIDPLLERGGGSSLYFRRT
jgi:predicted O-methyltransferase YrrM